MANLVPIAAPLAVAVVAVIAGRLATRRRPEWRPVAAAAALVVGWAVLAGGPRAWWAPRLVVDHLAGAALALVLGAAMAVRLRGRAQAWAALIAAGAAAWWIAGAPAARPEFWRCWFAVMVLGWVVRRFGFDAGAPALALGSTLAFGLFAAGAPLGDVVVAVVVCGVVLVGWRERRAVPAMALAVAVAAAELGAGRLVRGGIGMVELVCVAAIAAAALRGWAGGVLQRRLGRSTEVVAPVALALAGAAFAWIGARALRG